MRKITWIVGFVGVVGLGAVGSVGAQPVEHDSSKAAVGRAIFKSYCASCHGREARGDGPVAKYMEVAPSDLTGIAARNGGTFPDDYIAEMIDGREKGVRGHGSKEMPIWGDAFQKLDTDLQVEVLLEMPRREGARLMEDMDPDERVDLAKALPGEEAEKLVPLIAQAERNEIARLAHYEEGTAGSVMTTEYRVSSFI